MNVMTELAALCRLPGPAAALVYQRASVYSSLEVDEADGIQVLIIIIIITV